MYFSANLMDVNKKKQKKNANVEDEKPLLKFLNNY